MRTRTAYLLVLGLLFSSQFLGAPGSLLNQNSWALPAAFSESARLVGQGVLDVDDVRFGRNVRVIDDSSRYPQQVEPTMAILSTGRILVGWKEAETDDGPGFRVGFAYSNDSGQSFSSNILMAPSIPGHHQSDPWLVADHQDNAYFVFLDWGPDPESGIGVAKTIDGGETWLPTVDASDTPGFDDKETACVDGDGNLYIVWDEYNGEDHLRFTKSTDGGQTFTPTTSPFEPYIPYITCSNNGTLYVTTDAWFSLGGPAGDRVWITRSDDGGTTWTSKIIVTPLIYNEVGIITVVDTDSQGNVYVAYSAGTTTDKDIFVIKSLDGGYTWEPPVRINAVTTGMQRMAEMTIDTTDTIHVGWLDAQHGEWNIYYSYSNNSGTTFAPNVRVTSQGTSLSYWRPGDYFTMRTGPNGLVHLVWTDGRGTDQDIYFAKQDIANPVVNHYPITNWYQNTPLPLVVTVTDDDYVQNVELHYKNPGAPTWRTLIMENIDSETFQSTIPAPVITSPLLQYYLVAIDAAGRETRLPEIEAFQMTIAVFSPSLLITLVGASILIIVLLIGAFWYLRRTPKQQSD